MLRAFIPRDRLQIVLAQIVIAAVACVVLLPVARGDSAVFGALPLWLIGLPLASFIGLALLRGYTADPVPVRLHDRRRPRQTVVARRGGHRPLPQRFGLRRSA